MNIYTRATLVSSVRPLLLLAALVSGYVAGLGLTNAGNAISEHYSMSDTALPLLLLTLSLMGLIGIWGVKTLFQPNKIVGQTIDAFLVASAIVAISAFINPLLSEFYGEIGQAIQSLVTKHMSVLQYESVPVAR